MLIYHCCSISRSLKQYAFLKLSPKSRWLIDGEESAIKDQRILAKALLGDGGVKCRLAKRLVYFA